MAEFKSIDDFVNYRSSDGGGGKRLKSWAKQKGRLDFWLHTALMPARIWTHPVPELIVRTDRATGVTKRNVWSRAQGCHESEEILRKWRFKNANGSQEHSPCACGLCRTLEAVRVAIHEGRIRDVDVLFRWEGSDKPEENIALHAGGMCGFWKRDQDDADKARLAQHGIYMSKAWSESMVAKLQYVFVGVDHDDQASGVQVAVQTQLVGDKVRKVIRQQIASKGPQRGNPLVNPYCIRLVHQPQEQKFDDKYDAFPIEMNVLTPEIDRLIREAPPSIDNFLKKFDPRDVRSKLEAHATDIAKQKLDWNRIWDVPKVAQVPASAPTTERVSKAVPPEHPVHGYPGKPPLPAADPKLEYDDPCEQCGKPMLKGQMQCGECGTTYEDDATPKGAVQAPFVAPTPSPMPETYDDEMAYDDEIPFD